VIYMAGYDIHFQPVPDADVVGYRMFTFGFKAALKVQGPQALVNRWAKTFMTPKGSDPLDITMGTTFAQLIGANITHVSNELQDVAFLSVLDANNQVKHQDLDGLFPANESLHSATISNFIESTAGVELWVEIKTISGDALTVKLITLADR
jgi:hypothetical protein